MKRKNINDVIHGDRKSGIKTGTLWDELDNKTPNLADAAFSKTATTTSYKSVDQMSEAQLAQHYAKTGTSKGNVVNYQSKSNSTFKTCYHNHPPLKLPGTELVIYGGSCNHPAVEDADVYIGFDQGMRFTQRHWPWKKGAEVLYAVRDFHAPENPEEYKKLIAWTRKQLDEGKKVHAGCIGGHGRTGTFFAALVSTYGEEDAITYVRENYCHKVVESNAQIDFLHTHFGVKKVGGSKEGGHFQKQNGHSKVTSTVHSGKTKHVTPAKMSSVETIQPFGKHSIWGANLP
jgi:hypothetical protein